MLKDKIGFIGVGQCGGNIVKNFEDNGYNCLFVNTSEKDLETINGRYKIHFPEANGCSKHRDRAIILAKKHHRLILNEVIDKLEEQDFIYLVTSTGGGSGSGMTPILLDILTASLPQKGFGCVAVLPSKKETIQTQINSVMFFQQLLNVANLKSIIVLDNEKDDKFIINNLFYNLFDDMLQIPEHISEFGNLDESEILQMLNTAGCMVITDCIGKANTSGIIRTWEDNIYAPLEKDKELKYLGLSLQEEIEINDLIKYIGTPLDIFQGYNNEKVITILAGLSLPIRRINEMNNIAKGNKDIIFKSAKKPEIKLDVSWLTEEIGNSLEHKEEPIKLDDLFAKY